MTMISLTAQCYIDDAIKSLGYAIAILSPKCKAIFLNIKTDLEEKRKNEDNFIAKE